MSTPPASEAAAARLDYIERELRRLPLAFAGLRQRLERDAARLREMLDAAGTVCGEQGE